MDRTRAALDEGSLLSGAKPAGVWNVFGGMAALLMVPLLDLIHELGHAAIAYRKVNDRIVLTVGPIDAGQEVNVKRIGRLDVAIKLGMGTARAYIGTAGLSPKARAAVAAGGPLASLAAGVCVGVVAWGCWGTPWLTGFLVTACAYLIVFGFVLQAIPRTRPEGRSDGQRLVDGWRGRRPQSPPQSNEDDA